ncbi:MAG: ribosome biogenesis GTP-binding protein YihA/YsxC [Elusimicrobia bacterium]|nr:ribosome biogenesis GTP-binding protein YihA/YsxC [Elusimicrobiota bacterium]
MTKLRDAHYTRTVVDHLLLGECKAEVAFVGRSNVGKSSVLNAVCNQKNLARTSQTPGKTRTINVFETARGKWIIDLPGYGFAVGPASERNTWPEMIENYLTNRPSLRMVYMLIDAKVGPTKLDRQMAIWLQSKSIPYRVIANKVDKIPAPLQQARRKEIAGALGIRAEDMRWVSATKPIGMRELEHEVAEELSL